MSINILPPLVCWITSPRSRHIIFSPCVPRYMIGSTRITHSLALGTSLSHSIQYSSRVTPDITSSPGKKLTSNVSSALPPQPTLQGHSPLVPHSSSHSNPRILRPSASPSSSITTKSFYFTSEAIYGRPSKKKALFSMCSPSLLVDTRSGSQELLLESSHI
jgi:hypothetical protein